MAKPTLEEVLKRDDVKQHIADQIQHMNDTNDCEGCKERDLTITDLESQIDALKTKSEDSSKTLEAGMKEIMEKKDSISAELVIAKQSVADKTAEVTALVTENKDLKQAEHEMVIDRIIDIMQTNGTVKAINGQTVIEVRKEMHDKLVTRSIESINDKLNDLIATSSSIAEAAAPKPGTKVVTPSVNGGEVEDSNSTEEAPAKKENNILSLKNVLDANTAEFIRFSEDV